MITDNAVNAGTTIGLLEVSADQSLLRHGNDGHGYSYSTTALADGFRRAR